MLRLREAAGRGLETLSRAILQQPDYKSELSDEYLGALEKQLEDKKPKNFTLTPISEPGW